MTFIFFNILWYQEDNEIIHVEVITGSDKKGTIVTAEKKIHPVNTDTEDEDCDMEPGMNLTGYQFGPVFPDRRQLITYHPAEGTI